MRVCTILLLGHLVCFSAISQGYVAGYKVAKENVIRSIPVAFIQKAQHDFNIAYQHTSHGTHVTYGLFGLQDYKLGDKQLFAISRNTEEAGKLSLFDYAIESYAEPGEDATDLSSDQEAAFIQATRNYLDDPLNANINVVMWSWCNIAEHNVTDIYLPGMQTLIDEYGHGGTKLGSDVGQRAIPVDFIFMTGHANQNENIGEGKPKSQSDLITNYCQSNGYYCLDYYSIDTYCMNDVYYEDAGEDGDSQIYGGNYYHDFEGSSLLGHDYYENKEMPDGNVVYGSHTTQHITSNRKAYAMWWILARLAGWDGVSTSMKDENKQKLLEFDVTQQVLLIDESLVGQSYLCIYNLSGQCVFKQDIDNARLFIHQLSNGIYIASLQAGQVTYIKKIVVQN